MYNQSPFLETSKVMKGCETHEKFVRKRRFEKKRRESGIQYTDTCRTETSLTY